MLNPFPPKVKPTFNLQDLKSNKVPFQEKRNKFVTSFQHTTSENNIYTSLYNKKTANLIYEDPSLTK